MNNKIIKFDDIEGKVYEIDDWKAIQAPTLKNHFTERLKEIKKQYDVLLNEVNWNKIIYNSNILFEPVVGKVYHLYKNKNNNNFMSLVEPDEWGDNTSVSFIGSFKQDSSKKWIPLNNNNSNNG
tara:strand:- start:731 stop:1102 length:372 start_codon:yes stop_codon:yes gene_type:complete